MNAQLQKREHECIIKENKSMVVWCQRSLFHNKDMLNK